MRAAVLSALCSLLLLLNSNGAEMRLDGKAISALKAFYRAQQGAVDLSLFKESADEQYTLACTIPQLKVGRYLFGERQASALLLDRQTPYYSRYFDNGQPKHTVGYVDIQAIDAKSRHVRGVVRGKVLKLPKGRQAARLVELVATFDCSPR